MKQLIIAIIAVGFVTWGCGNKATPKNNQQTDTINSEEHHHHDESIEIELDNGKKWIVDKNMMTHIRNMEKDVAAFNKVELKDYHDLAAQLQINVDLLTSNCTMKGKAHDELHKWLLPYIDLVTELAETKNEKEATKVFENIQASFQTFNQFFE